jgi:hypothetical protein
MWWLQLAGQGRAWTISMYRFGKVVLFKAMPNVAVRMQHSFATTFIAEALLVCESLLSR